MRVSRISILTFILIILFPPAASAGNKAMIHGIYMIPYGRDAKEVSRPGWGIGADFLTELPGAKNILNGFVGVEYVNLLSKSSDGQAAVEGILLPYSKDTDQWYGRLRVGAQMGGFGNAFFRPYAAIAAALVVYAVDTDLDFNPGSSDQEFTEHQYDDLDAVFGYDLTVGMDLNVSSAISIDGGVKYLKSFSVPDQLGEGSVKIYPQYFQVYLGIGVPIF